MNENKELQDSPIIDIKMQVTTRLNKKDIPYKMLTLYFIDKESGEFIPFHDIYIKDNLSQIIDYLIKKNQS